MATLSFISVALSLPASAANSGTRETATGYVWNPETGELNAYYNTPQEVLPEITMSETDLTPYVEPTMPLVIAKTFYSYSPSTYTYDYTNERFKIGTVRVDNSKNHSDASLTFVVSQSSSTSIAITAGAELGGEINAIFQKAQLKFNAEVAYTASWTKGQTVQTSSVVPPGQIGKVTAYIIGIYSHGTAAYRIFNSTTDKSTYVTEGCGAIIPTTNSWNLVVEVPCS